MELPPLRQSLVETAECPRAYVAMVIEGQASPDSIPSERGTDIHHVMSEYVRWCAANNLTADWEKFDILSDSSGPEAGRLLDNVRDRFEINPKLVYGTEVPLALTEEFEPTVMIGDAEIPEIPGVDYVNAPAAHTGTLDVVLISEDGKRAKVPDYKSHFAIFEADTYQATLYPFMLFKHLPSLETVTFELQFLRYRNQTRAVTWRREDMPQMQGEIARARARQRKTHENPEKALALPCKVCAYCPLAKNLTCPLAEWNEYTNLNNSDRLRAVEFYRRMKVLHQPILKAHAAVTGPISYELPSGKKVTYGMEEVPATKYPLDAATMQVLNTYSDASGERWEKMGLCISSTTIKPKLATKKRAALREVFEEVIIQTSTKPKYTVKTEDGELVEENAYREDE